MINVLQIPFELEVQMPRYKNILLSEFLFAYTLFSFEILLKCPHIYESQPTYTSNSDEFLESTVPLIFIGKVMYDCNRDESIAHLTSQREIEAVCREQLIIFCFLVSSFQQSNTSISSNHIQTLVDSQVFPIAASYIENH